ncbi:MAG TPA: N-methyl-L-tryptophan oxidase [Candidatus Baltobacteraceae bacterium]|nr:N-methyl-L-tryptophan oxidase [Candidatus Baltobacteraceae bacterium]
MTAIVVGLGGMGSAALYHLARRGVHAIGLEQFSPGHLRGASHGRSRVIRQAYFEDSRYVPLLKRSYELWADLNAKAVDPIWNLCGGLAVGDPQSALIAGNLESARAHDIAHELLAPAGIAKRFPAFKPKPNEIGVYEPTAGAVFPERAVVEHLRAAIAHGAQAHFGVPVSRIDSARESVTVTMADGTVFKGERLILTAGPWLRDFAPFPVRVERNVQHWFEPPQGPAPDLVFMAQRPEWPYLLYGFPDLGEGVKAAFHHSGAFIAHAREHDERAHGEEIAGVRHALEALFGDIGKHRRSEPCMYALTPDEHFIIGTSPKDANVIVAGGFSGHGFKFCSVVGEILADLCVDGSTPLDISLFNPARFATGE